MRRCTVKRFENLTELRLRVRRMTGLLQQQAIAGARLFPRIIGYETGILAQRLFIFALKLQRAGIDEVRIVRDKTGVGGLQRIERGLRSGTIAMKELRPRQPHQQRRIVMKLTA